MLGVPRFLMALVLAVTVGSVPVAAAKYKIKDLQVKPPQEYVVHQAFQQVVIGAYACDTLPKVQELFDTDKLTEKRIVPMLVVIENHNTFSIRIEESEIFLVDASGEQNLPLPWVDALLEANLKKPLSGYSGKKELLIERSVKKEMYLDFEHKAFGEKIIPPGGMDFGVVFFRMPEAGSLKATSLYLPEVVDMSTDQPLMFFELPLLP